MSESNPLEIRKRAMFVNLGQPFLPMFHLFAIYSRTCRHLIKHKPWRCSINFINSFCRSFRNLLLLAGESEGDPLEIRKRAVIVNLRQLFLSMFHRFVISSSNSIYSPIQWIMIVPHKFHILMRVASILLNVEKETYLNWWQLFC